MADKKIYLVHPLQGVRGFDIEHAKRLMGMGNNGGWEYQKDEQPKKRDRAKKTKSEGKEE